MLFQFAVLSEIIYSSVNGYAGFCYKLILKMRRR